MQDVPHRHDIDGWQRHREEIARHEPDALRDTLLLRVIGEYGTRRRQVKTDAGEVRMSPCNLDGQISLGRADVDERAIFRPRKIRSDREIGPTAKTRHRANKLPESRRLGIEPIEE